MLSADSREVTWLRGYVSSLDGIANPGDVRDELRELLADVDRLGQVMLRIRE